MLRKGRNLDMETAADPIGQLKMKRKYRVILPIIRDDEGYLDFKIMELLFGDLLLLVDTPSSQMASSILKGQLNEKE